ncbi:GTPase Era [candidate division KSB1 bacterium]|nr:GTPase Era [candidate division KSB1 bacterium]
MKDNKNKTNYKVGYIALIGKPNVGKSTLMNVLLGQKLSIVTPKPQTTRHRILGILSEENTQMIFLDTPGLLKPRYKLQDKMLGAARRAIDESDVLLLMVEPEEKIDEVIINILSTMKGSQKSVILVINKIDTVNKKKLLPIIDRYASKFNLTKIFPISALKQEGLDELKSCLKDNLPKGFPFYPEDMITEHPERFFVSEIIREKIFQNYGDEIPYSTTVLIEEFKEREGRKDFIRANIIVEKDSQKGILIGKKGAALKKVGSSARDQIEQFLDREVYLELFVKVREKWRKKDVFLKEFGYG